MIVNLYTLSSLSEDPYRGFISLVPKTVLFYLPILKLTVYFNSLSFINTVYFRL